ncbi:SART-1 family protein DOT2 [Melia azedarach]|nr:SART-1 family protein DOT2 [Melia azedarach]
MDQFDRDESPVREHSDEGAYHDNLDRNGAEHRSKDRKSRSRGDDKDHRSKDRKDLEKDRKERRKEDRDERDKERSKDRERHRDRDKDRREKEPERDREIEKERGKDKSRDRETEKERGKDKSRDREKERDKAKDKEREKGREKHKDRSKERESEKDREREKAKEKSREKGREMEIEKERPREREHMSKRAYEEDYTRSNSNALKFENDDDRDRDINKQGKVSFHDKDLQDDQGASSRAPGADVQDRILKMREDRLKKKPEGVSEVLAWVNRSRKLEEKKNVEKQKALQLSKTFEEQDNIAQGESDDEEGGQHNKHDLAGVKVLHGLDKVMEGGAVVLTLKDQNILAEGDINEDVDMLENVEIGEQKRRDEAYKAAKKKTGIYDDKFNDDPSSEKKILPQYDDPAAEEGLTLDAKGRFTGEAEKKLEELRRRIQGVATTNRLEDLSSSAKAIRKKEKLDLDALEAEAVSTGLGVGDLGSRNEGRRQAIREEQERSEAEMKSKAYQSAYAKADEAIKSLRMEQTVQVKLEDEEPIVAEDDEDLHKSLERARKLALKKQEEASSGPEAIARAATTAANSQPDDDQNTTNEESQENKVVFTELQEFVWGLPLGEEAHKLDRKDFFMDEDEGPRTSDQEMKDEPGGWSEVIETEVDENPATEDKEEIVPDETIHEVAVGKGLSGVLKLLKDRGTLKEGIEWGGRNMDKKKSKLVGIVDDSGNTDRFKDIRIERTDEFGRIMTPKEAFRMISHKFHGKGPGKMKQEKRMKQYQEELKLKQMKNSDTPTESVERMREAQARLKTPYLVLSGHVKPGQTSDPRSGFATVEKDLPGGLTPMLGNRKVEHFLGIKRKSEAEKTDSPKKPKS